MLKTFQIRVAVVLLAGFTLAAAILASLNFAKDGSFSLPTDQVLWVEARGGLEAQRVLKDGPGERAGIKAGDLLTAANGASIPRMASLTRQWGASGIYRRVDYLLIRSGVPIHASVILEPADRSLYQGLRLIDIEVVGDTVVLSGHVVTFHLKQLATVFARRVAGVVEVVNRLDDSKHLPWLDEHHVTLLLGHGKLTGERTIDLEGETYTARRAIVLATGSEPLIPPVPGLAEAHGWTNREGTTSSTVPERLIVLGGGFVGVELGQAWSTFGSHVTIVEAGPRLLARE